MTSKRGNIVLVAVVVIVLLLFLGVFSLQKVYTGFAALGTRGDMLQEVQAFVDKLPFTADLGEGSTVCMEIDTGSSIYAYHLEKHGSDITISESREPECSGPLQEDFIIKFTSYEAFLDAKNSPGCAKFLSNGRGQNYWFLPSKLWPKGDYPECNEEFKEKYCPAVYHCIDPEQAPGNTLSCCTESAMSPVQLQRAKDAARIGLQENERMTKSTILETPLTPTSLTWQIILVVGLLVLVFASVIVIRRKTGTTKKRETAMQELEAYIMTALDQDFPESEIKQELRNRGWPEDAISSAYAVAQTNRTPETTWRNI